jgi:hypothetical protein
MSGIDTEVALQPWRRRLRVPPAFGNFAPDCMAPYSMFIVTAVRISNIAKEVTVNAAFTLERSTLSLSELRGHFKLVLSHLSGTSFPVSDISSWWLSFVSIFFWWYISRLNFFLPLLCPVFCTPTSALFTGTLSHHSSLPSVRLPVVYISVFPSNLNLLDVVFSRILFHGPEVQIQPQNKYIFLLDPATKRSVPNHIIVCLLSKVLGTKSYSL